MKIVNDILYIEFAELISCGVSENTIVSAKSRQSKGWTFIEDPSDKRKVLIEYSGLSDVYKDKLTVRFGNPYDFVAKQPIKNMVQHDSKAEHFFLSYRFDGNKLLPLEHVKKYTRAASWLNMLSTAKEDKKALKTRLNLSVVQFFFHVCELIKIENIDLPTNYRKLHARIDEYIKDGYSSLISRKFGNKSAAKINDELCESVLLEMIAHPNQFDDVLITMQYNQWANGNGYATITAATVGIHRRKNEYLITQERDGNENLKEKFLKQVKGRRPSFPMAMVESDDNHIDLQFRDLDTGNKFVRYKAVIVIDSFNDYVLGYAYTTDDVTINLIKAAYINAMYHIRSITGAWHLPHEVKTDQFGISTLMPYYESIGNYFKTPVGSKHRGYIEPFFSSPHWKRCQKFGANNYTGNNMTALTRGVNVEVVRSNINKRPILGRESEIQMEQVFYRLRHLPNKEGISKQQEWLAAWNNLAEDKKRVISDEQFLLTFGIEHKHQNSISNRGVEPNILNHKYSYDLPKYDMSLIGKKVTIIYDPYDMSRVLLTNHEDVRLMAYEAKFASRALADADLNSRTFLNNILQEKEDSVKEIAKKSKQRKDTLKLNFVEAEAVLTSGVLEKGLRQAAEQKYFEQQTGFQNDDF